MRRAWAVALSLLVAGCADPELASLQATLNAFKQHAGAPADLPATSPERSGPAAYRHVDAPSPFQALPSRRRDAVAPAALDDSTGQLGPLLRFPLEALRLVGTLQRKRQGLALVATPQHQVVTVRTGDVISQSQAEIVAIDKQAITVKTRVFSEQQGWQEQLDALMLDPSPGSQNP